MDRCLILMKWMKKMRIPMLEANMIIVPLHNSKGIKMQITSNNLTKVCKMMKFVIFCENVFIYFQKFTQMRNKVARIKRSTNKMVMMTMRISIKIRNSLNNKSKFNKYRISKTYKLKKVMRSLIPHNLLIKTQVLSRQIPKVNMSPNQMRTNH